MSRILLIEDDPLVLQVLKDALDDAGHYVDTADTFKAGDRLFSSREYDAIVADGLLPDGQGAMLATKAAERGIPALLITGYRHGLSHAYPSIDFDKYTILEKPVGAKDFLKAIETLLAGSQPNSRIG